MEKTPNVRLRTRKTASTSVARGTKKSVSRHRPSRKKPAKTSMSVRLAAWGASLLRKEGVTRPWVIWAVTALAACLLLTGVYYFSFRPYLIANRELDACYAATCVHGLDISHHQGEIDWQRVGAATYRSYPIRFVFMKATEGGDFVDEMFQYNFAKARAEGLICGAYHFFLPDTPADAQADLFISQVRLQPGDLPPVLDLEVVGRGGGEALRRGARRWIERVERHYGVRPIIYASYKFKMKYLDDSFFSGYPYWIAHYYVSNLQYEGEWSFWQHTDLGSIDGVEGSVDLDIFNGTLSELESFVIK